MKTLTHIGGVALLCLLAGCQVDPYCLLCFDASTPDATAPPDGCVPGGDEFCNGRDDNCNDVIDEGFDLDTDPQNCGQCGVVCDFPHATAACVEGECVMRDCLPGAADFDGEPDNGCEADCTVTATVNSEFCSGGDCCDGADNDCDGEVGEDHDVRRDPANCGACSSTCDVFPCRHVCSAPFAESACVDGVCQITGCQPNYQDLDRDPSNGCEYHCVPVGEEECNGSDDDCDGEVDEGVVPIGASCGPSEGTCEQGTLACVNGLIRCVGGVGPSAEVCDGADNDCDGENDEDDICSATGDGDGDGFSPSEGDCDDSDPEVHPDAAEVCGDGKDNDCDTLVDGDDPDLGLGEVCDDGSGVGNTGVCAWGTRACRAGEVVCVDFVGPIEEVCNGQDDDCNGQIDDGIALSRTCGPNPLNLGTMACISGEDVCVGFLPFRPEVCDGQDNDGDDDFDEGVECRDEAQCQDGQCRIACSDEDNQLPCPPGMRCTEGYCRGPLCDDHECDACQRCDPSTGLCVDRCAGLTCPTGLICYCGECWPPTCGVLGCPRYQVCREGECTSDDCAAADCDDDQGCAEGVCFDVCEHNQCERGLRCVRGECVDDPCVGLTCPIGRCNPETGTCSNLCAAATCPPGEVCDLDTGKCVDDPCLLVRCPEGSRCREGSCFEPPPDEIPDGGPPPDSGPEEDAGPGTPDATTNQVVLATGGGGCVCNAAAARTAAGPVALIVAFLALCVAVLRQRS